MSASLSIIMKKKLRVTKRSVSPVASSGEFGPLKFCYVDTSPVMMGMVEVLEDLPFIHNYFARVRQGAENWDGSRPIRDANELAG